MNFAILPLLLVLVGQSNSELEPAHRRNRIYVELLGSASKLGETSATLPAPILRDGLSGEEQQAAILRVAGSEQSRKELLRDSVTAPFILKVHDTPTEDTVVRRIDLWFVVRGDLTKLDPLRLAGENSGKAIEVGNMRFESRILNAEELKKRGQATQVEKDLSSWFVFVKGRLLGRTAFQATDEAMASRTLESMVVAARTSAAFDPAGAFSNRWWTIAAGGESGPEQPFAGGLCYVKVNQLKDATDALLIEMHCAFSEPRGWFQGEPILRSKFALIAQDQVRRLRRELAMNRLKTSP